MARRNGQSAGICLIEVDLMDGDPGSFERFLGNLGDDVSLEATDASLFSLALREFHFRDRRPDSPDYGITKSDSESVAARKIVCRDARVLRDAEPAVRVGLDAEAVRTMRIAARRIRTAIRLFRKKLPPDARRISRELRWLNRELAGVRDLETRIEVLGAYENRVDGEELDRLRAMRISAEEALVAARRGTLEILETSRYRSIVEGLEELCSLEEPVKDPEERKAPAAARRVLRKTLDNVANHDRKLRKKIPLDKLRGLLRSIERLRCACDYFRAVSAPEVAKFVARTERLEASLASVLDLTATVEDLREGDDRNEGDGRNGVRGDRVARRIADRMEADRGDLVEEFRVAWKKFRKRKNLRLADPVR
jgi:CHAD domain-containing protein